MNVRYHTGQFLEFSELSGLKVTSKLSSCIGDEVGSFISCVSAMSGVSDEGTMVFDIQEYISSGWFKSVKSVIPTRQWLTTIQRHQWMLEKGQRDDPTGWLQVYRIIPGLQVMDAGYADDEGVGVPKQYAIASLWNRKE